ncbi:uncharacterized protein LOC129757431 [Uranotaenia lowii]|uniref:uncharacterized protein LOC129757431 n=1 Tax=Uranotaenia lowii TaxID=190385 RepID=UPI00247A6F23|nr:uncharacterized protein LOC129757431 [Uranotaenia lowii]
MEVRWYWSAFILLIAVSNSVVTHDITSSSSSSHPTHGYASSRGIGNSNNESTNPVNLNDNLENQPSSMHASKKQDIDANYNLDELASSIDALAATKSVKKYLKKENQKYRKKYKPVEENLEGAAAQSHEDQAPLRREPRESDGATQQKGPINESEKPHSRKKRLIWITDDGRLALPPGTSLTIAPTIALPFVRYPPTGFLSNISISLPVTIDFDKLGLTDNQNPLGVLPPLLARSMGRAAGSILADYVSDYMRTRRRKRNVASYENDNFRIFENTIDGNDGITPQLPEEHRHAFHGGERALLYTVVEDFIANFGIDGKACILRAICEVHSKPVEGFGLIGEMLKLFLTASLSPYSEHLDEYVMAENIGKGIEGPAECFPYFKDCPKSLFRMKSNLMPPHDHPEEEVHLNSIDELERDIRNARKQDYASNDEGMIEVEQNVPKMAM